MQFVAISGSFLDSCLEGLAEIADSIAVGDGQITKVNEASLMGVDVVPDFCHVFARKRNAHALNRSLEVLLVDLTLATLVEVAEDFCLVAMLVLHSGQYHAGDVLHVIDLRLRLNNGQSRSRILDLLIAVSLDWLQQERFVRTEIHVNQRCKTYLVIFLGVHDIVHPRRVVFVTIDLQRIALHELGH